MTMSRGADRPPGECHGGGALTGWRGVQAGDAARDGAIELFRACMHATDRTPPPARTGRSRRPLPPHSGPLKISLAPILFPINPTHGLRPTVTSFHAVRSFSWLIALPDRPLTCSQQW
jgi:hypothetical protein